MLVAEVCRDTLLRVRLRPHMIYFPSIRGGGRAEARPYNILRLRRCKSEFVILYTSSRIKNGAHPVWISPAFV
jgi:hypothetical protein